MDYQHAPQNQATLHLEPKPQQRMPQNQQDQNAPNKPLARFTAGAVSATVWSNQSQGKDGESYNTVSLQRRYRDREGNWKSASALRVNDLPKAHLVLSKAYEFLVMQDADEETR